MDSRGDEPDKTKVRLARGKAVHGSHEFESIEADPFALWTGMERLCIAVIQSAIQDFREGLPPSDQEKRLDEDLRGVRGRGAQRIARGLIRRLRKRQAAFQSAQAFLFGEPSYLDLMAAGLGLDADRIRGLARKDAVSTTNGGQEIS